MGNLRVFQCSFKDISKKSRKFPECFDRLSRKFLKHINSLSKKVCFVVVVCPSSQLPEQKEGLFSLEVYLDQYCTKILLLYDNFV